MVEFKVGDIVKVRPELIGGRCSFGSTFDKEYFEDQTHKIKRINADGHIVITYKGFGDSWNVSAFEIMLANGEEQVEQVPVYNFKSNVYGNLFDFAVGDYINIHQDACKGKLDAKALYKIRDIDFGAEEIIISYNRRIKFKDAYVTKFNTFEEDDEAIIPSNVSAVSLSLAAHYNPEEIVNPKTFRSGLRSRFIPNWWKGVAKPVEVPLDEAYYRKTYPQFFAPEPTEIFGTVFLVGVNKRSFKVAMNGEEVLIAHDANRGQFTFNGV